MKEIVMIAPPRCAIALLALLLTLGLLPLSAAGQCVEKAASHVGDSDIKPYEANESCFVQDDDPTLDLPTLVFGSGEAKTTYDFYTTRYAGSVDGDGFLEKTQQHLDQGTLAEWLTLTIIWRLTTGDWTGTLGDPLLDAELILNEGTAREASLGPLVGIFEPADRPTDTTVPFQQFTVDVKTDDLRFPGDPGCSSEHTCSELEPQRNELTIKFTGEFFSPFFCNEEIVYCPEVEVDWISVGTEEDEGLAWRPVLLLHGLGSSSSSMLPGSAWDQGLSSRDVARHAVSLTPPFDTIERHGPQVTRAVTEMKERFGVDRINVVGHSKGGLDARESVQYHDDVETLIMLGTPNSGSGIANPSLLAAVPAARLDFLGVQQMSTFHMMAYNWSYQHNSETQYVAAAGNHRGDSPGRSMFSQDNDTVVPVWSVISLPYADNSIYTSTDRYTDHFGLPDHTQILDDVFNAYLSVRTASNAISPLAAPTDIAPLSVSTGTRGQSANAAADERQTVFADDGVTEHGQTVLHPLVLDAADTAFVLLQWAQDELALALVSPSGTRVDAITSDSAVTYFSSSAEGWLHYAGYSIAAPEAGNWTLEVTGTAVSSPNGEPYSVALLASGSRYALSAAVDNNAYLNSDLVTITATITEGGAPVTDAIVEATARHPDLTTSTALTLYDDGTNGDPSAGDGRYTTGFSATTEPGVYTIAVKAERTGIAAFTRLAAQIASVAASRSALTGAASDVGVDVDGDGLYDSLALDLGVDVDVAATYYIFATLTDGSGTEIESVRVKANLDVGAQTAALSFDGTNLRSLGLDGPYVLADVALVEGSTGIQLGSSIAAHTTRAFLHTNFQRPAILLTGVTSDAGVDLYGDASYERLMVEIEVDVLWQGDYRWSANLYSQDGTFIAGAGDHRSLSAGVALLDFAFDGWNIVQTGRSGPYELRLLAMGARNLMAAAVASDADAAAVVLEPSASLLVSETIATTQAYTLADFGGPLPVELATFAAVADGKGALLTWTTLSETNNAGFEIEQQPPLTADGAQPDWQVLAYVEGQGTTTEKQTYAYRTDALAPGLHRFRLKQIDHDGAATFSPEVEIDLEVPGTHVLSAAHPNPFNPQTTITLAVRTAQHVHIAVYDALGRRVALLHDSLLEPRKTHRFVFDGAGRASGLYLVRLTGDQFQEVQRVVLVR